MKEKIIELRTIRPIPIGEAKQLLIDNDGDIETCVLLYTAKAINMIVDATGTDKANADKHYRIEKFDINRSISAIKDEIFDANYQPIEGVNKTSLQFIKDWIYILENNDFGYSLSYSQLPKTIEVMLLIPELTDMAKLLEDVKNEYDIIFEGYSDNSPLDEFIRRNTQLDSSLSFQKANSLIPLQIVSIKGIISRHWRNLLQ